MWALCTSVCSGPWTRRLATHHGCFWKQNNYTQCPHLSSCINHCPGLAVFTLAALSRPPALTPVALCLLGPFLGNSEGGMMHGGSRKGISNQCVWGIRRRGQKTKKGVARLAESKPSFTFVLIWPCLCLYEASLLCRVHMHTPLLTWDSVWTHTVWEF